MAVSDDPPYVDAISLTDTDTHIYETIATLEYLGRTATQEEIAALGGLGDRHVADALADLVGRGLLLRAESRGVIVYEPARRDWSAVTEGLG